MSIKIDNMSSCYLKVYLRIATPSCTQYAPTNSIVAHYFDQEVELNGNFEFGNNLVFDFNDTCALPRTGVQILAKTGDGFATDRVIITSQLDGMVYIPYSYLGYYNDMNLMNNDMCWYQDIDSSNLNYRTPLIFPVSP